MNITQYIKKKLGTFVDFDGWYGPQCVDLIRDYVKEVYGEVLGTTLPTGAAKGWFYLPSSFPKWNRIENDMSKPDQIPRAGDIIFFGGGQYGHVGIVNESFEMKNRVDVVEQNAVGGKGESIPGDEIRITSYKYTDNPFYGPVLGWYTRKDGNQPTDWSEEQEKKGKRVEEEIKEEIKLEQPEIETKINISNEVKEIENNIISIKNKLGIS